MILIDAHMPIRDGLQTAQALRDDQATRHATLIAMTGSGDSDAVSRGLKSLADFVVDKPFHPDTLLNYLQVAAA